MNKIIKKVLKTLDETKDLIKHNKEISQINREMHREENLLGYYERPKDPVIKGTGLSVEEPKKHYFL